MKEFKVLKISILLIFLFEFNLTYSQNDAPISDFELSDSFKMSSRTFYYFIS